MADLLDAVRALSELPGVPDAVEQARDAATRLRWHPALRKRVPQAAGESRVRGARSTADLDGAEVDADTVRDLFRGAVAWPAHPDPVETTLRAAVQVTAETEHVANVLRRAPAQAVARLHVAAGEPLLASDRVGRPRADGEGCRELVELGPAPDAAQARQRLRGVLELIRVQDRAPTLLVAAIVHAEVAAARPFAAGNGLVARALERVLLQVGGLDPTGVCVPEAGHARHSAADYVGGLQAYVAGGTEGVRLWLLECADAVTAGARAGTRICDAVLAGRLAGL